MHQVGGSGASDTASRRTARVSSMLSSATTRSNARIIGADLVIVPKDVPDDAVKEMLPEWLTVSAGCTYE